MSALLTGGVVAWAGATGANKDESSPARPSVVVKVDPAPLPRPEGGELSFAPIVKRVAPSVVKVVTRVDARDVEAPGSTRGTPFDDPMFRRFFGPMAPDQPQGQRRFFREPPQMGLGSGVIVSADGYIITNSHVVEGADKVRVTLDDGRELPAEVIGSDKRTDIAVIKIDATDLPAVTFADSEAVQRGDRVLAIGNPFGFDQTVTTGIVSAIGRSGAADLDYENFIQTDAAINPGNSGGALVDLQGRLIGINTAIFSRTGGFQGIGFAIPSDLARHIMENLVQFGHVTRGYLGVGISRLTPALAKEFGLPADARGAVVGSIEEDGPAAKAGLQVYDVITNFEGKPVIDSGRFRFDVAAAKPGTEASIGVWRDGKTETLAITVGRRPDETGVAATGGTTEDEGVLNGVGVTDITPAIRREYEIPAGVQGAFVTQVEPYSPSAEAGLSPGDVIQEVNRKSVRSAEDAIRLTEERGDGRTLVKVWSRGGTHLILVDESDQPARHR
jgi:serine protease Do